MTENMQADSVQSRQAGFVRYCLKDKKLTKTIYGGITMLKGKTVLLCVSSSIAAYKIPNLARMLTKLGAEVHVAMTPNSVNFVHPLTFETLTQHKCLIDTFDRNFEYSVEHVSIAKKADVVMVAPASANVIGKIANGIADDMLTTTVMACTCKKIIAPAMNHNMFHNPIVQENISKLRKYGYEIIEPVRGMLANRDIGDGKLPDENTLLEYIIGQTYPRYRRGDPRKYRSGALHHESFKRKNGLCIGKGCNAPRS